MFQEFYRKVMNNADIIQAVGDAICTLSEVQCLTPRWELYTYQACRYTES